MWKELRFEKTRTNQCGESEKNGRNGKRRRAAPPVTLVFEYKYTNTVVNIGCPDNGYRI